MRLAAEPSTRRRRPRGCSGMSISGISFPRGAQFPHAVKDAARLSLPRSHFSGALIALFNRRAGLVNAGARLRRPRWFPESALGGLAGIT